MIFRISTGWARDAQDAADYATFLEENILPELRGLPGHEGAYLLRRQTPRGFEMTIVTMWQSIDAIKAFTGEDVEAAVFEPEAARLLPDREDRVRLCEVVVDASTA